MKENTKTLNTLKKKTKHYRQKNLEIYVVYFRDEKCISFRALNEKKNRY